MEKRNGICGDGALLLGYAAGALSSEETARVARHLDGCHPCQVLLRENRALAEIYGALAVEPGVHPSPEALTQWVDGTLHDDLTSLQTHLRKCGECRQIVSVLRKVEAGSASALQRLAETARRLHPLWSGFRSRLSPWLLSPVPAYLLVVLLLYPAYLGLAGWGRLEERVNELEALRLLPPPTPLRPEAQRGVGTRPPTIERHQGRAVVTFFVPIAAEQFSYQVELLKDGERLFADSDAESFDGVGTFALLLAEGSLEPGNYELRVEERDRRSGQTASVVSFSFSITRSVPHHGEPN